MRVLLFDIDGTLIWGHGVGHRALVQAMRDVFGTAGRHEEYDWRGKTDPLIVTDLLRQAGIPDDRVAARLPECFDRYVHHLEDSLADGHRIDVLPGVEKLLSALAERPEVLIGLLTGNVQRGAIAKLRPTGLLPFFRFGAYGSDDPERRRLPSIARERIRMLTGREIQFAEMTVIGDTPLDVDCARACGARAVAVVTGQHSMAELAACEPDDLFPSFADVEAAVCALVRPGPRRCGLGSETPWITEDAIMDKDTRRQLIEKYKDGHRVVTEALKGLKERDFDLRLPGKWSIREILHHLADSEMVASVRLRRLVAEDRPGIRATDVGGYVRRLFYDRPAQSSLDLFRAVRASTAEILDRMTDADWAREGVRSGTGRFTAEKWLEVFSQHADTHADEIQRTRAAAK